MGPTILLIDDDPEIRHLFKTALIKAGYNVKTASDGREGLSLLYHLEPDLIILDIMMPEMDGWQTCQRIREMTDVPIIMLTALNIQENIIKGLNMGADDYLVKPVPLKTLEARIRVMLRRSIPVTELKIEPLTINFERHEVRIDDRPVSLSPTEFRLLSVLARNKGRVLSYEELLRQVWGDSCSTDINTLRTFIGYLRRKLEDDPANPQLIQTEWKVGYRLSAN